MDILLDLKYIQFYEEEAQSEISNALDTYVLGDYFMEDGEAKTNLFSRIKDAVVKFFKNLTERISNLFDKKEVASLDTKDIDPNAKIKLSAKNQKLMEEGNITLKELDKCKSAEDVDRAMTKYRRKKTAIKAMTATVVVGAVAAVSYVHAKKNKELKQYKADQEKMLKDIDAAQREAANERTARAKEQNAAREEKEALYAQLESKEKELTKLKQANKTAQKRGHSDAVVDVTRAKIEIKRDQAEATTNIINETIQKVKGSGSIKDKVSAVTETRENINEAHHKVATSKAKQLYAKYQEYKKKGIKLKNGADIRVSIITSDIASKEDKARAWEWIEKNEPKLYYLQARAGTTRRGAEQIKSKADHSYVKGLTHKGLSRINSGGGRKTAASRTSKQNRH